MIVSRWRWPAPSLRASVAATDAVALVVVIALASIARPRLTLSALFAAKAATAFVALAGLAAGLVGAHHPFAHYGRANQVTTLRALLVALVAGAIGEPASAGLATAVAGVTLMVTALDGVDGWLARRSRMASAFGARFDMEVDALLIMVLSITAWRLEKAGAWVLLSGLLRYAFVAAGWLQPWLERRLAPNRRRQTVCVVQIAALNLVMLPAVAPPASVWLSAVALVALAASFLVDVMWLWRQSRRVQ